MATFATRLKEMRLANDLTQKQLGEEIGVTAQSVSLWERGPRKPDDDTINALCIRLNVSREYLFGFTSEYAPYKSSSSNEKVDLKALMEDDYQLWKMTVRMCQLSSEMREMVKASIRQAYRLDKQNDRLKPFDSHRVRIVSAELEERADEIAPEFDVIPDEE